MTSIAYAPLAGVYNNGHFTSAADLHNSRANSDAMETRQESHCHGNDEGPQAGIEVQGRACSLPWFGRMMASTVAVMLLVSYSIAGARRELPNDAGKPHQIANLDKQQPHQSEETIHGLQQKFGVMEAYRGIMQTDPFTFHCPLPLFKKSALRNMDHKAALTSCCHDYEAMPLQWPYQFPECSNHANCSTCWRQSGEADLMRRPVA